MKQKAQSINELVIVGACIAVVLLIMGTYVQRSMRGKYKQLSDLSLGAGQYDPEKGVSIDIHQQSGKSVSMSRMEEKDFSNKTIRYMVSYQAAGHTMSQDKGGNVTFTQAPADDLKEITVEHREYDWEDLSVPKQ